MTLPAAPAPRLDTIALEMPLASLPGVGPVYAGLIARLVGGPRLLDLIFHLPDGLIDRRYVPTLAEAEPGRVATLAVRVQQVSPPARTRQPWRVIVADATGEAELVFFTRNRPPLVARGLDVVVSGRLERFGTRLTMPHPDHILPAERATQLPMLEAVWPLGGGATNRMLRRAFRAALPRLPAFTEWHDPQVVARERWPGFDEALRLLHQPEAYADRLDGAGYARAAQAARARLAADELLADQIAKGRARRRERSRPGRALAGDGALQAQALARFGFPPTASQARAIAEIDADLAAPVRMLRLLQGDVGAGKTLVALMAMLRAAEAGTQAALMAPTEVLARQHHRTLSRLAPVPVGLLTGSVKGTARRTLLRQLGDGSVTLVVGTHALFQEAVSFHDLGVAVIDEQHRFGVEQRLSLGEKGEQTDVLVMTATPIPRTVLLTQWGEMGVSRLSEKPAGRKPVRTTVHGLGTLPEVVDGIARMVESGAQVFWVCPLVGESEASDLAAAQERHATLTRRFPPGLVGLAHGQQAIEVREMALQDFATGRTRLLVATTVIEVGVDVPQASVMVVEHAERFGLAQLHQLRGRVGRGAAQSYCLLLHDEAITATGRKRLGLLRETEDGFLIADEDFKIRGGGDLLGKRQSGLPGYRLANVDDLDRLLRLAWQDAERLLDKDPALETPRGLAARTLLTLFDRADALRTLGSG